MPLQICRSHQLKSGFGCPRENFIPYSIIYCTLSTLEKQGQTFSCKYNLGRKQTSVVPCPDQFFNPSIRCDALPPRPRIFWPAKPAWPAYPDDKDTGWRIAHNGYSYPPIFVHPCIFLSRTADRETSSPIDVCDPPSEY